MLKKINLQPKLIPWLIDNKIFSQEPVKILDIGARGGLEEHWKVYQSDIVQIGIEPDRVECDRLNKNSDEHHIFYPFALGRKTEKRPFYVCQGQGSSSFYPANREFIERFDAQSSQLMTIRQTIEQETISLDTFCEQENLTQLDFIKLDVEGSELDILQGGKECLKQVIGLSLEVLFHSFLRNQPTFSEIDLWLQEQGFYLYDLASYRHGRKDFDLPSDSYGNTQDGQVLWAQALYLRDGFQELDRSDSSLSKNQTKILKLASFMELFCLPDCTFELLKKAVEYQLIEQDLDLMFDLLKSQTIPRNSKHNQKPSKSLASYLTIIESAITPTIINNNNWNNIKAIASIFPQAITNFFGFEYRLSNNDTYTDFLLCIDAAETGKKILGDDNYKLKLPQELLEQPEWQQLTNFGNVWCKEDSPLDNLVHNVWLEFDLDSEVSSTPIPSVFFGISPSETETNFDWVTDTALPLLLNRPVSANVKQGVKRCLATIPTEAHVFQIGLMLSRSVDAVRLCIRNIKPQEIVPFLEQMGWGGDKDNLAKLLEELTPFVDRIDLDIDVGDGIYPKIGLECYFTYQPSLQPKWELFFAYLVKSGLCTEEKQQKLLNFPGFDRLGKTDGKLKLEHLIGRKQETILFRGLHHIKLSYKQNRVTEAKAYLYASRSQIDVGEFNTRAKTIRGEKQC